MVRKSFVGSCNCLSATFFSCFLPWSQGRTGNLFHSPWRTDPPATTRRNETHRSLNSAWNNNYDMIAFCAWNVGKYLLPDSEISGTVLIYLRASHSTIVFVCEKAGKITRPIFNACNQAKSLWGCGEKKFPADPTKKLSPPTTLHFRNEWKNFPFTLLLLFIILTTNNKLWRQ